MATKYKPGDRVTFINDYGVRFPGKKIVRAADVEAEGWTSLEPRYYIEPTDSPWFPVAEHNLFPEASDRLPLGCLLAGLALVSLLIGAHPAEAKSAEQVCADNLAEIQRQTEKLSELPYFMEAEKRQALALVDALWLRNADCQIWAFGDAQEQRAFEDKEWVRHARQN